MQKKALENIHHPLMIKTQRKNRGELAQLDKEYL